MTAYLVGHWRGTQGLARSFWVNLVALRVLLFALQEAALPLVDDRVAVHRIAMLAFAALAHGVVLAWQLVGTVRACDAHLRALGSMANVWGAQLGMIVASILAAVHVLGAWQSLDPPGEDDGAHRRMLAERASRYRFETSADGTRTRLSGTFEHGITAALREHLTLNPGTRTVELDSPGGNVHEGRGAARVFRDAGLDTLVTDRCSSACTVAFIGGRRRLLARGARLGFHGYRIDADYPVLGADPETAQRRDRELYASAGVAPAFVERMFATDGDDLWRPSPRELLDAGVVTALVD